MKISKGAICVLGSVCKESHIFSSVWVPEVSQVSSLTFFTVNHFNESNGGHHAYLGPGKGLGSLFNSSMCSARAVAHSESARSENFK